MSEMHYFSNKFSKLISRSQATDPKFLAKPIGGLL